uniref:Uncharacterized protein n=1 Tax=Anguilla anguilla TaxID=7936 RepID=A0A0E9XAR0_ANGAN
MSVSRLLCAIEQLILSE